MTTIEYPRHDFYAPKHATYVSSLAASATAPVYSDAPSQNHQTLSKPPVPATVADAPLSLRQNSRRTSNTATSRNGCPPSLVRQTERKLNFVEQLVDSSTQIVMAVWPNSSPRCPEASRDSSVLPLRIFISETLRRSRTSYSTLQVALYYLVLIKDKLPAFDFTMEQTDDCNDTHALQCGRRMFLAALILASKYLQDRNYSARAWSKISGLNTNEINSNEMAFVKRVNWKLHISEEVYHQWTDGVMKYCPLQPPNPPSSGSLAAKKDYEVQVDLFSKQCAFFRKIIRMLNPDLGNLEDAVAHSDCSRVPSLSPRSLSPRSVLAAAQAGSGEFPFELSDLGGSRDVTPKPTRIFRTPAIMEPSLISAESTTRVAPAFGLLPTPRLTPQVSGPSPPLSWPRGSASYRNRGGAMGMVMNAAAPAQQDMMVLDKWPGSMTSSPMIYAARRPSYAASVSTVSSPESMVSDLSGSSRSSSISSVSSLASASYVKMDYNNLEIQARCRSAKQIVSERYAMMPTISSTADDYAETATSRSSSLQYAEWKSRCETDDAYMEAAQALHAAHALQALHSHSYAIPKPVTSAPKAGTKRSRPDSVDLGLQDSVRDLLRSDDALAPTIINSYAQTPVCSGDGRKRVCCSVEAAQYHQLPAMENQSSGNWEMI